MPILPKQTIVSNINSEILDNSRMMISPYDVRHNLIDMIDSTYLFLEGKNINTANFSTPDTRTTIAGDGALDKLYLPEYVSIDNTAIGYYSLHNNFNGGENTAIGSYSETCNVYGSGNTAVGYKSLAGNTFGDNNTVLGANALQSNKYGSNNIAIGNGAGYYHGSGIGEKYSNKFYLGVNDVSSFTDCPDITEGGGGVPLMYGELDNIKLGIGTKKLHTSSTLEVSGAISPSLSGTYDLGEQNFGWKTAWLSDSINDDIYFSGGKLGVGTPSPSGSEGLVTVAGNLVPHEGYKYKLGTPDLKWIGHFSKLNVDTFSALTFENVVDCVYECRTLYLASSGVCDGEPTPCGYLDDDTLSGAGLVIVSSGTSPSNYRRRYEWIFSPSGNAPDCLEDHNINSQSSWNSSISINIASGNHLQTDRIIGREKLSLLSESGCFGLFFENDLHSNNSNTVYFSRERHIDGTDVIQNKASGVNFLSSGVNYDVHYTSLTSGVVVGQKFVSRASRIKNTGGVDHVVGFGINYTDAQDEVLSGQKKDRLTISAYDDATSPLDAITLMRTKGPGLVGITDSSLNPLPNTIFNVQSTGNAVVRVMSPTSYDSTLQLLGRNNSATHGLDITYDEGDERADLSMISSSTKTKVISIDDNNVGIKVESPQSDLSVGGEISMSQFTYGRTASNNTGFGKIFVTAGNTSAVPQILIFQDDEGNQINISPNDRDINLSSTVFGDSNGNQFVGYQSPESREASDLSNNSRNVGFGYQALNLLNRGAGDDNIAIGYRAGRSLLSTASRNIFIGSDAGAGIVGGDRNIVIGHNVADNEINSNIDRSIIIGMDNIGRNASSDYSLYVGMGDSYTILKGIMGPNQSDKFLEVPNAKFIVSQGSDNMTLTHSTNFFGTDKVASIFNKNDSFSNNPDGGVAFTFTGADNAEKTLMTMRHHVDAMTITPSFAVASPERPSISVSGDINILGGLRFSDGTSVTLESNEMNLGGSIRADSTNKRITVGDIGTNPAADAAFEIIPKTASERIQEWKNEAGNVVAYVDQDGDMHIAGTYKQF